MTAPDDHITTENDPLRIPAVLQRLTIDQIRWVIARQQYTTDKEAAESIGLKPDTVYRWPDEVREVARLLALDGVSAATELRRRYLAKAMLVKVAGLDSLDEKLRQAVATEIIEWELGKAAQRQEHSGPAGGPIEVIEVSR